MVLNEAGFLREKKSPDDTFTFGRGKKSSSGGLMIFWFKKFKIPDI